MLLVLPCLLGLTLTSSRKSCLGLVTELVSSFNLLRRRAAHMCIESFAAVFLKVGLRNDLHHRSVLTVVC